MLLAQQCGLGLNADLRWCDALSLDNPNVQTQQMMPLDYAELASRIELRSGTLSPLGRFHFYAQREYRNG